MRSRRQDTFSEALGVARDSGMSLQQVTSICAAERSPRILAHAIPQEVFGTPRWGCRT